MEYNIDCERTVTMGTLWANFHAYSTECDRFDFEVGFPLPDQDTHTNKQINEYIAYIHDLIVRYIENRLSPYTRKHSINGYGCNEFVEDEIREQMFQDDQID